MRLLLALFVVGVIVIAARIFFEMLPGTVMPWACPRCHAGSDQNFAGTQRHWYRRLGSGRVRCRHCHTSFKEHPNGTLVEDR